MVALHYYPLLLKAQKVYNMLLPPVWRQIGELGGKEPNQFYSCDTDEVVHGSPSLSARPKKVNIAKELGDDVYSIADTLAQTNRLIYLVPLVFGQPVADNDKPAQGSRREGASSPRIARPERSR